MKKWLLLITITIMTLMLGACQTTKALKKPQVLVTIPSYENLLKNVLGDRFEVICVVPEGFNPHYFEVRPNDLNKIQNPKFWFGINEAFEPKLLESLKARFPNLRYFNLVESIPTKSLIIDHHCHDDHSDCHHHHHEIDMVDNHIWMSPKLLKIQMDFIQKQILDLSEKEIIAFKTLNHQLYQLENRLKEALKPYENQAILVSHASFGYFCQDFGLKQISIEFEGKQPMPRDLEKLANQLESSKVICVLAQIQFDQKGAILIAKKLGKPLYTIDPYSKNYFEMMKELEQNITGTHD